MTTVCAEPLCPALATRPDGHCPIHEGGYFYWSDVHWIGNQRISHCATCHKDFKRKEKLVRRDGQAYHLKCWSAKQTL